MDRTEQLSAYLDNALDAADRAALEAELASDPALAEELARLRGNDGMLQQAFGLPEGDPAADRLRAMIAAAPPAGARPSEVIDFAAARERKQARQPSRMAGWRWPAAAAAALVLGIFIGNRVPAPNGDPADGIATSAALNASLDTIPSNRSAALGAGAKLTPVLSFAAGDGRFCRQFVIDGRAGGKAGIACRGNRGWTIEALAPHQAAPVPGGGFEAASGPADDGLDTAFARLKGGDPLGADAERRLIRDHWRR